MAWRRLKNHLACSVLAVAMGAGCGGRTDQSMPGDGADITPTPSPSTDDDTPVGTGAVGGGTTPSFESFAAECNRACQLIGQCEGFQTAEECRRDCARAYYDFSDGCIGIAHAFVHCVADALQNSGQCDVDYLAETLCRPQFVAMDQCREPEEVEPPEPTPTGCPGFGTINNDGSYCEVTYECQNGTYSAVCNSTPRSNIAECSCSSPNGAAGFTMESLGFSNCDYAVKFCGFQQ